MSSRLVDPLWYSRSGCVAATGTALAQSVAIEEQPHESDDQPDLPWNAHRVHGDVEDSKNDENHGNSTSISTLIFAT